MSEVVYGPSITENEVVYTKIEASQKGWFAVRALAELIEVIAVFETGDPDWGKYLDAKDAALRALKAFERWHGKEG